MADNTFTYFNGLQDVKVNNLTELDNMNQEEVNMLATGPQDLFYEKLEYINRCLESEGIDNIEVTNKWNWKPKTYDKVKGLIYNRLYLHKKTNGLDSLLHRTTDRINYLGYIKRMTNDMEYERNKLKRMGVSKDVDINEFKEKVKEFTETIINQCETVYEATNKKVLIIPYFDKITNRNPQLYYDVSLVDLQLNVFDGDKSIQKIDLDRMHLILNIDLRRKLGLNNSNFSANGKIDSIFNLLHPYISSRGSYSYGSVCFDKYFEDINKALRNNELLSFAFILLEWAQYYNLKYSNPYNQPHMAHLGMPKEFSKEYVACQSQSSVLSFTERRLERYVDNLELNDEDRAEFIVKSYDDIECQFRDSSSHYNRNKKTVNVLNSNCGFKLQAMALMITEYYTDIINNLEQISEDDMQAISSEIARYFKYVDIKYWLFLNDDGFDREGMCDMIFNKMYYHCFDKQTGQAYEMTEEMLSSFYYTDNLIKWLENKEFIEITYKKSDDVKKETTEDIEELTKMWAYSSEGR
ncbi:MAG: hypothetical protein Tp132SUR00d2C45923861_45 [Prokaryotic dsDNA virus sp.]|nr:MAG: hypothetical protein Tp132SUR00d2C45923861_45 [Prokaryotic dsDNA virus sp.]|tara:strand:+ start:41569 stop:43137 length:1569 start_codon:yes stop_codon:yes gene_type:complete